MRKRRMSKGLINKKIVLITIVFSMSFIGVGYASWHDSTEIKMTVNTGFIKKTIELSGNEQFYVSQCNNKNTMYIKGKMHHEYEGTLIINVEDYIGAIPSKIKGIYDENNNDIEVTDNSFEIIIKPNSNNPSSNLTAINVDDIKGLQNNISMIEEEINSYNKIDNYSFNYTVVYGLEELGIWDKELNIKGNIKVIPNPDKSEAMEIMKQDYIKQLDLEFEKQQKAIEVEKLLEAQKLIEHQKLKEEEKLLEQHNPTTETTEQPIIDITEEINDNITNIEKNDSNTNDRDLKNIPGNSNQITEDEIESKNESIEETKEDISTEESTENNTTELSE